MASQEHKNKRRALALERLNLAFARLAAKYKLEAPSLPRKAKDRDMLEIVVFERMAEFLEGISKGAPRLIDNPLVQRQAQRGITGDERSKAKRRSKHTSSSEVNDNGG